MTIAARPPASRRQTTARAASRMAGGVIATRSCVFYSIDPCEWRSGRVGFSAPSGSRKCADFHFWNQSFGARRHWPRISLGARRRAKCAPLLHGLGLPHGHDGRQHLGLQSQCLMTAAQFHSNLASKAVATGGTNCSATDGTATRRSSRVKPKLASLERMRRLTHFLDRHNRVKAQTEGFRNK